MSTEDFLRDFHRKYPGCTSVVLATGRTEEGETSYDIVASPLKAHTPTSILDLACGDGYLLEQVRATYAPTATLTGVDLSPDELSAAAHRLANTEVSLHEGRAQRLPFADATFDAVLCHLAFMLMDQIEEVVAEIHRVLRPGGVFSAVVMGPPHDDPATAIFRTVFEEILHEEGIAKPTPLGDARTRETDGLRGLFVSKPFQAPVEFRDFVVRWRVPAPAVVEYFELTYGVGRLPTETRARFATRYLERLRPLEDQEHLVLHAQSLRHLMVRKPG